jgi:hypothetical protein
MSDGESLERLAQTAKTILEKARAVLKKKGEESAWAEPDANDVNAVASMMLQMHLAEEVRGQGQFPAVSVHPQGKWIFCGFHFAGRVDAQGRPKVYLLGRGQTRSLPHEAFSVAVFCPPGKEAELRKTFPNLP